MDGDAVAAFAGMVVAMVVAGAIVYHASRSAWQNDLIARGLAIYCPENGDFAFKGECKE